MVHCKKYHGSARIKSASLEARGLDETAWNSTLDFADAYSARLLSCGAIIRCGGCGSKFQRKQRKNLFSRGLGGDETLVEKYRWESPRPSASCRKVVGGGVRYPTSAGLLWGDFGSREARLWRAVPQGAGCRKWSAVLPVCRRTLKNGKGVRRWLDSGRPSYVRLRPVPQPDPSSTRRSKFPKRETLAPRGLPVDKMLPEQLGNMLSARCP